MEAPALRTNQTMILTKAIDLVQRTIAARIIEQLANIAIRKRFAFEGRRKSKKKELKRKIENGEKIELDFDLKPGAMLMKESEEVRNVLKELKSEDIKEETK